MHRSTSVTDARAEPERPLVAVIGGGVSGLAAARVLAGLGPVSEGGASAGGGRGVRVIVLEAGPAMGGKVTSGELRRATRGSSAPTSSCGAIRAPRGSAGSSGWARTS